MRSLGSRVYIALVHYPVLNKHKEEVATAITNLDIHDLARLARTYELGGCYLVNPMKSQRDHAQELIRHWQEGYGATFNPDRAYALECITLCETVEQVIAQLNNEEPRITLIATSAKESDQCTVISYYFLRHLLEDGNRLLLLFGTGWGLSPQVFKMADYLLKPISPDSSYNHLSVRSAASIIIDRLLGTRFDI